MALRGRIKNNRFWLGSGVSVVAASEVNKKGILKNIVFFTSTHYLAAKRLIINVDGEELINIPVSDGDSERGGLITRAILGNGAAAGNVTGESKVGTIHVNTSGSTGNTVVGGSWELNLPFQNSFEVIISHVTGAADATNSTSGNQMTVNYAVEV
ncbi:hypothetical protein [Alkalihalophilus marmarensis]|uniref:hypothetical protein n=1 Tax=Alkalihalophilus marmarensis TaxID=521377 RepID=UPI002DB5D5C5|nr:hypothetical protein [Alkalihalophilus marmarensis]MEC2070347.1 hypothetical protein [Alkalihalophilus marmarensis]